MKSLVIKSVIAVIGVLGVIILFTFGDKILPSDDTAVFYEQDSSKYLDEFIFEPEELRYDGTGELDLLEGVSLEGYSAQELKPLVFTRISKGESLSEKVIEYKVETDKGKIRSIRPLKLYNYTGPKVHIPNELPDVTRQGLDRFGELLVMKSGYAVDDGFGKDVRDHAEIEYELDAKESFLAHYTISFANMFGDSDVVKVDVSLSGVPAYLSLTESEVTLNVGTAFNPADYVARAELADGTEAFAAVRYESNVNTAKKGIYKVTYNLEGEPLTLIVNVI